MGRVGERRCLGSAWCHLVALAPSRTQLDVDFTVEEEGRRYIWCQGEDKCTLWEMPEKEKREERRTEV